MKRAARGFCSRYRAPSGSARKKARHAACSVPFRIDEIIGQDLIEIPALISNLDERSPQYPRGCVIVRVEAEE
jgi:hypothetical protein